MALPGSSFLQEGAFKYISLFDHKILLSYESQDKIIILQRSWNYQEFLEQVQMMFPKLTKNFSLIDADFMDITEENYEQMRKSNATETWLLVQDNGVKAEKEDTSFTLEKPQYELLKYDVHPNALTQSGSYHFSACYQAFCEFIDNAIQATNSNTGCRNIHLHMFLKQRIACIVDNGSGMSSEGMKAFLSYFLSQKDRGLEKDPTSTYGYMDGNISKFGVGATQAGFYLGDAIKVITKMKTSPLVTEIIISKDKLQERASNNLPVFEDYKCIRNPGDTSTLSNDEKSCLKNLIESEMSMSNFTMVIIKDIHLQHINYMVEDKCDDLAVNLAHVYHYYLHGSEGSLKKLQFDRVPLDGLHKSLKSRINIHLSVYGGSGSPSKRSLCEIQNDLQSLYQEHAKSVFSFCLELQIPEITNPQVVQGCLLYFPNDSGTETVPDSSIGTGESASPDPLFECFWQGRLAPLSYVNRLQFCMKPESRTRKQKDQLPDICFNRIRGVLFFNRHTPVSNNKLKILLDTRRDLSDALRDASSARRLPNEFRQWLELSHQEYDREFTYDVPLPQSQQPKNGDEYYGQLKILTSSGEEVFVSGETVKIDTRPVAYGKVKYFIKKHKTNDVDSIVYSKLPEEIYGDLIENKSIMRIAGKPDPATLKKIFATEMLHMPKELKVYEGKDGNEVKSELKMHAGEEMKKKTAFYAVVYNGERPPKLITDVCQQKVSVKLMITGCNSVVNNMPIDTKYSFKPFFLDKVGRYEVSFSAFVNDTLTSATNSIHINVIPNVADIVNLLENSPEFVPIGEKVISFKLSFHDVFENNTCSFRDSKLSVKLICTCDQLNIHGVKEKYTPDKNGFLTVSGISVVAKEGHKVNLSHDYQFWIVAEGIGDVMFPFRVVTGPPEKILMTPLDSLEFENYGLFPELEIKLLDKCNQQTAIRDKSHRLALTCDAFTQRVLMSTVSLGRAKFPTARIKIEKISKPVKKTILISLVVPEAQKKKMVINKTIKELHKFNIHILPSSVCKRIQVIHNDTFIENDNSELTIDAVAGTTIEQLSIVGFSENGKKLTNEELLSQDIHVTTTWADVNSKKLPALPKCPVTNVLQLNVQSVQCFCKFNGFEIRNEAKLRISVKAGKPVQWSFQPLTLSVRSDAPKDLTEAVKVTALDEHRNPSSSVKEFKPYITVEHTGKEKMVEYGGSLIYKKGAFYFTEQSFLKGHCGQITLHVQDENGTLSKDSISIQLCVGLPAKLLVTSSLIESVEPHKLQLKMLSKSSLTRPLTVAVIDSFGNPSEVKTKLTLSWLPESEGTGVSRQTNSKGEVTFHGNQVKTLASSGNHTLQVTAAYNGIQPALIDVQVLQCNRITNITAHVDAAQNLTAKDNLPALKISHETEDKVIVPDFKNNVEIILGQPDGKTSSGNQYYPVNLRIMDEHGVLLCTPVKDVVLKQSGQWQVRCIYTETRQEIRELSGSSNSISSKLNSFDVLPGKPEKITWNMPANTVLSASNTADIMGRTLLPVRKNFTGSPNPVLLSVVDEFDNPVSFDRVLTLRIESCDEVCDDKTVLPELDKEFTTISVKGLSTEVPRIRLKENIGNKTGYYNLVFTAPSLQQLKVQFSFSTTMEIEKITKKLVPLEFYISECRRLLKQKCEEYGRKKEEVRKKMSVCKNYFSDPNPSIQEVDIAISKIRNESYMYENSQKHARPCRKKNSFPSDNVRQYIKGLVCELAYVSDEKLCCLLSWYAQGKMKVALCETKEQQKRVYDLGYPAYSENLIIGFGKNGFQPGVTDILPIDLPKPPADFQSSFHFAVNLLEFRDDVKYLRSTLFYSIFSRTIVVDDLENAQRYREHVIKRRQPCPSILTMTGDLIAADGLMDPSRRCPRNLSALPYAFGELPPMERKEYRGLCSKIHALQTLRQLTIDCNVAEQDVKQAGINLDQTETQHKPAITELKERLEKERRMSSQLETECSPAKRKRR